MPQIFSQDMVVYLTDWIACSSTHRSSTISLSFTSTSERLQLKADDHEKDPSDSWWRGHSAWSGCRSIRWRNRRFCAVPGGTQRSSSEGERLSSQERKAERGNR